LAEYVVLRALETGREAQHRLHHDSKPNIIFILADDLGFETLGCYGGKTYKQNGKVLGAVKTPNLDAMAKNGMLFKTCFATPVCSPARSEVLTGKYNFRTGFPSITGMDGAVKRLDSKAHPTVAMQLKESGYDTTVVGKWHLGPPESMKETRPRPKKIQTIRIHGNVGLCDKALSAVRTWSSMANQKQGNTPRNDCRNGRYAISKAAKHKPLRSFFIMLHPFRMSLSRQRR
jgi:arylsulfatase A-like enzyme